MFSQVDRSSEKSRGRLGIGLWLLVGNIRSCHKGLGQRVRDLDDMTGLACVRSNAFSS
jgi:hypothetical protein